MTTKDTLETLKQTVRTLEELLDKPKWKKEFPLEANELEDLTSSIRSIRRRIKSHLKDDKV